MTSADPKLTPAAALAHLSNVCPFAIRGLAKLINSSIAECLEQIDNLGFIALVELEALGAIQLCPSSIKSGSSDRFTFTEFFFDILYYAESITA